MLADTSLRAYETIKRIGQKQMIVYRYIEEHGPVCNLEISDGLEWEINRVTGRVHELEELGKIEVAYRDKCRTGRLAKYWRLVPEQEQLL